MSDKKYLVISHNYWPAIGGAEKLLQSIAENLYEADNCVEVLTSNAKNSEMYFAKRQELIGVKLEKINNILVRRESIRNIVQITGKVLWKIFEKKNKILNDFGPLMIGPHFPLFLAQYIFSRKKYTHIICGPYPTSVVFYGSLMKFLKPSTKIILVPCIHVADAFHAGRMLISVARTADNILVLTEEETIYFQSIGINKDKIIEIGVGIDEKLLKSDNKLSDNFKGSVLFMGQEVSHKNIILLIESMVKIWKNGSDAELVIAGARTGFSEIIDSYIENLEMRYQNKIIRKNDFDENKKIELLDSCSMLVLPSSRESFGLVFIEAWARKKPVVGADVPGVRCLIENNKNGLLFQDGNSEDLSEKIYFLLQNEKMSIDMGRLGYDMVIKKYKWDIIIDKIINI